MRKTKFIYLSVILILLLQQNGYCENPRVTYVELTDKSTHAGTRKSRSTLKCVETESDIALKAVAGITNDDGTKPNWSSTAGSVSPEEGATTVWTGQTDASITAELTDGSSSASLNVIGEEKTTLEWDSDPYKKALEKFAEALTKFADQSGANNPAAFSGKLSFISKKVDMHNDGEKIGLSRALESTLKISMARIKAESPRIPTPWPFLFVSVGVDCEPISLNLVGSVKYDEQFVNPWVASSISVNPSSSVKASVKALIGASAPFGEAGVEVSGSAEVSMQATVNFKGEGSRIVSDGSVKMGSLVLSYEVKALVEVLGAAAEWQITAGQKEVSSEVIEIEIPRKVLYEW